MVGRGPDDEEEGLSSWTGIGSGPSDRIRDTKLANDPYQHGSKSRGQNMGIDFKDEKFAFVWLQTALRKEMEK